MSGSYSIRASVRLLGVAPSTVSRHIPRDGIRPGRRATLTSREVLDLASEIGIDAATVRRRMELGLDFEPDMPTGATRWLELALTLDLPSSVRRHETRVPARYWAESAPPLSEFTFSELPLAGIEWQPLTAESLDELAPPDNA